MSEELIEITCVKCGRTILVRDRWDTCPVSDCRALIAGYGDDVLDVALDELAREMKVITDRMKRLSHRVYLRTKKC